MGANDEYSPVRFRMLEVLKSSKNGHKPVHRGKVSVRLGKKTIKNWRREEMKGPKKRGPSDRLKRLERLVPTFRPFEGLIKI